MAKLNRRVVILFWIIGTLFGCQQEHSLPEKEIQPGETENAEQLQVNKSFHDFVGSDKCIECHRQIHDEYQSHPMSRSIRLMSELSEEVLDSLPQVITSGTRVFSANRNDADQLVQTEEVKANGTVSPHRHETASFAVGSGTHGHTFVLFDKGCLFQMPLTWYSADQKWDLSPGYEANSNPGFNRRITNGCMSCHAGHINTESQHRNRFVEPLLTEKNIGCERCHGPGKTHVDFHTNAAASVSASDPMLQLSKLSPAERDSICYQCHLLGRGRILLNGHTEDDFRPGDRISDHWVSLVSEHAESGLRVAGHPEQMTGSICYQKSDGRMSCTTCHDPHRKPAETERIEFYQEKCATCHKIDINSCKLSMSERASVNNSCIECHMPGATTSNVPHTARTNHSILRRPQKSINSAANHVPSGIKPFEPARFPVSSNDLARAIGISYSQQALITKSATDATAAIDDLAPLMAANDMPVLQNVAECMALLGHPDRAEKLILECLEIEPDNEALLEAAIRLATHLPTPEKLALIERYVQLNPRNPAVWQLEARLLGTVGKFEDAILATTKAIACAPHQRESYRLQAEMLNALGRHSEARASLEIAASLSKGF
ncbi:MAG: multiheme c-type cytochrome [Planctomycetaceae bacterium]